MSDGAFERLRLGTDTLGQITQRRGQVRALRAGMLEATLPGATLGELVAVDIAGASYLFEVADFSGIGVRLLPLEDHPPPRAGLAVEGLGYPLRARVPQTQGLLLDALGRTFSGLPDDTVLTGPLGSRSGALGTSARPALPSPLGLSVLQPPASALRRQLPKRPLATGIRVIDGFCTLAEGQRMGLFAGPGVGKTSLLTALAKNSDADVFIIALIGERGWELKAMLQDGFGGRIGSGYVLHAPSSAPPLAKVRCAQTALTLAEGLAREGKRVLFLVDSLTRVARAARQTAILLGEPAVQRGFPPSVFSILADLIERAGAFSWGTITAIYTILVEGSDHDEPIADESRALLDGHIILSRARFEAGIFPAVDPLRSLSRQMSFVTSEAYREVSHTLRRLLSRYEQDRDLLLLGNYQEGKDAELDRAVALEPEINRFLRQPTGEHTPIDLTYQGLARIVAASAR